jgi:cytochrome c biogenesis protein CcmG, thiol:disulfide interchange protein DsbE
MSVETGSRPGRSRRWLVLLPLGIFLALAAVFLLRLWSGADISRIPSVLVGSPAPKTTLPSLTGSGLPGWDSSRFMGKVTLVNVFASWCAPCREEHPVLMMLAEDTRFDIIGLNYKDKPTEAAAFLTGLGNPYDAVGVDPAGRAGIDWGVYGVPETFLIGRDGTVLYKQIGPILTESQATALLAEVEKALSAKTQ